AKPSSFVVLSEFLHARLQPRILDHPDKLRRRLRGRLAPAAARYSTCHPHIPNTGRHLRCTLGMSRNQPQPDTGNHSPQIEYQEQQSSPNQPTDAPRLWRSHNIRADQPCIYQQGLVLSSPPVARVFHNDSASLVCFLAECSLVSEIVIDDPFTPERLHGIQVKHGAAPAEVRGEGYPRSRIETDPPAAWKIRLYP